MVMTMMMVRGENNRGQNKQVVVGRGMNAFMQL